MLSYNAVISVSSKKKRTFLLETSNDKDKASRDNSKRYMATSQAKLLQDKSYQDAATDSFESRQDETNEGVPAKEGTILFNPFVHHSSNWVSWVKNLHKAQ